MRFRHLGLFFFVIAVLVPALPVGGATIVDTGFRPSVDGFSFANWAGLGDSDALSPAHMKQLLQSAGECNLTAADPYCTLRGGNKVTLSHLNEHLSAGRCEGMIVLAARIFKKSSYLLHVSLRARTLRDVTIDQSADEIAYWWASQLAPNVQEYTARTRTWTAARISAEITARLRNKVMVSIGVYAPGIAHAILPVSAVVGPTTTTFRVYDPNYPGVTKNLVVNRVKGTWTYAAGLRADGERVTLRGSGPGGLDFVPVAEFSHPAHWERIGAF